MKRSRPMQLKELLVRMATTAMATTRRLRQRQMPLRELLCSRRRSPYRSGCGVQTLGSSSQTRLQRTRSASIRASSPLLHSWVCNGRSLSKRRVIRPTIGHTLSDSAAGRARLCQGSTHAPARCSQSYRSCSPPTRLGAPATCASALPRARERLSLTRYPLFMRCCRAL